MPCLALVEAWGIHRHVTFVLDGVTGTATAGDADRQGDEETHG